MLCYRINNALKRILLFALIVALPGLKAAYSQEVFRLGINQPPPLIVTVSESIDATAGETINLGCGAEISIGELAQLAIDLVGRPVRIEVDAERLRPDKSEVMRLLSDNSKARKLLGWQPHVDIREGLSLTIDWIRQHLDLYRIGKYEV